MSELTKTALPGQLQCTCAGLGHSSILARDRCAEFFDEKYGENSKRYSYNPAVGLTDVYLRLSSETV